MAHMSATRPVCASASRVSTASAMHSAGTVAASASHAAVHTPAALAAAQPGERIAASNLATHCAVGMVPDGGPAPLATAGSSASSEPTSRRLPAWAHSIASLRLHRRAEGGGREQWATDKCARGADDNNTARGEGAAPRQTLLPIHVVNTPPSRVSKGACVSGHPLQRAASRGRPQELFPLTGPPRVPCALPAAQNSAASRQLKPELHALQA